MPQNTNSTGETLSEKVWNRHVVHQHTGESPRELRRRSWAATGEA